MNTFSPKHSFITFSLVFLMVLGFTSTAESINRLGWSAEQAAAWESMRASNHPFFQDLKNQADQAGIYNDDGLRDGMMYLITGNANYATRAWNHVSYFRGRTYNTSGVSPDRNMTRDRFLAMSRLFSWVANGLSATNKANFRDVLDHWSDRVFTPAHGTRPWDSDEMTGHYFGLVVYALAIRDEDLSRSNELLNKSGLSYSSTVGGVEPASPGYGTWRRAIALYATKAKGGQWMESVMYNLNSARYMLYGVKAINDFYGEDKFPEMTAIFPDFARALVAELTPDLKDSFQWGDVQTGNLRQLTLYSRLGLLSAIAGVTNDPEIRFLLNQFYNQYTSTPEGHVFPFLDANAPFASPSGVSYHNADGRGVAYHHSGWGNNDSFFASTAFNAINVDHERESVVNFNLYRNGSWAVTNPRGYYGSYVEAPYMNGMIINGGVAMAKEARGQAAFEAGDNYLYHVGLTGGQVIQANYDDPPLEFINEYSRSHLYLHNDDGSDTVVIFDRIKSQDPRTAMSGWKFNRFADLIKNRVNAADGKHQWIIHMPEQPTINGDLVSWVSEGGETVRLKTFDNDYTTAVYDEKALHNAGAPLYLGGYMNDSELKYQFRLVPNQKNGFLSLMNVVHVGSPLNASELAASSGESARGVYLSPGSQNVAVIFNGTEGATIPKTPCCNAANNWMSKHDPERFDNINNLRKFQTGFSMTVNSNGFTSVYVMDLDPAKSWKANVGGEEIDLTVSSEGVARFTYAESGVHVLSISTTGVGNQPPAAIIGSHQFNDLIASFDGSQSFDPEGQPLSFTWDFGDGNTSGQVSPTHTYAAAGDYTITLTVSDGVLSAQDTLNATIGSINVAPNMTSISDQTVKDGETLSFGVNATDANGDALILSATMGNGDLVDTIGATFTDNGNGTGVFSFTPTAAQIGDYLINFHVSDGSLNDTETIMVSVVPSVFIIEEIALEAENGNFSGAFTQVSDATAFGNAFAHTPEGSGNTYNTPNSVMATYNVNITQPGNFVLWARVRTPLLSKSDSFFVQMDNGTNYLYDTARDDTDWVWDQVSSRNGDDPVQFNLSAGSHTIKIKLREDGTQIDRLILTNNMSFDPAGPVFNFPPTASIAAPVVNDLTVNFDGSASSDPEGDNLTYLWDFGDGNSSTEAAPTHTYAVEGTFAVSLTVSDGESSDSANTSVTVESPNVAPVFASVADQTIEEDSTLSFTVDASDADGDALSLSTSSLNNATFTDNGDASGVFTFTPDNSQVGDHTVTFTVDDGELQDTVSMTITVTAKPVFAGEYHWLEAEIPDTLIAPMSSVNGAQASNGQYIGTANGTGSSYSTPGAGMVSFTVNVAEAGEYRLWARTLAPTGADNSFFIQMNNGPNHIWDIPKAGNLTWNEVTSRTTSGQAIQFNLQAGVNVIKFKLREDGTYVDKILLTNDLQFTPSGLGDPAENVPVYQTFVLEAESATRTGTFQANNDAAASGGQQVVAPNGTGNNFSPSSATMMTFTVNIVEAGDYILFGRVGASSTANNSFFVQVNNGKNNVWDTPISSGWAYGQVKDRNDGFVQVNLSPGTHTIKVKLREDGTKLDQLILTNDLEYTP